MADYFYVAGGTIRFRGCADFTVENQYTARFAARSRVYVCRSAQLGKMESIVIKKILLRYSDSQPIIVYKDTLNGLWNESDLCSEANAQTAVDRFVARLHSELENNVCINQTIEINAQVDS